MCPVLLVRLPPMCPVLLVRLMAQDTPKNTESRKSQNQAATSAALAGQFCKKISILKTFCNFISEKLEITTITV